MAGTIICDRIESDASFPSSINIASPMIVSNTITMGSAASISGDVNFDSGTLFVDSINNRVGVGTNTPVNNLHINGNFAIAKIQSTTNSGAQLRFENTQTSSTGFVVGLGGSTEGDGIIYHQDNKPVSIFTNGTQRLIVDGSGRVTMPNQPCFIVRNSANNTYPSTGSIKVALNSIVGGVNVGGHFNTTTNAFTAPVTGIYAFTLGSVVFPVQTDSPVFNLIKNDSVGAFTWFRYGNDRYNNISVTALVSLAANDTIYVQAAGANNQSGTLVGGETYFSGWLFS